MTTLTLKSTVNKKFEITLKCPTITALVFDAKVCRSVTWNCWNRTWLAGNRIINFCKLLQNFAL